MKSRLLLLILVVSVLFASSAFVSAQEVMCPPPTNCTDCDFSVCPDPSFTPVDIVPLVKGTKYENNCNNIPDGQIKIVACVKQWAWAYIPGNEIFLDISKPGCFSGLLLNICTDSNDVFGIKFPQIGWLYKDEDFTKPHIRMEYNIKICKKNDGCWETGWKEGTELRYVHWTQSKCTHLFKLYGRFEIDSKVDPGCYKRTIDVCFYYNGSMRVTGSMDEAA